MGLHEELDVVDNHLKRIEDIRREADRRIERVLLEICEHLDRIEEDWATKED